MQLRDITLHNFRCFKNAHFNFKAPIVLIRGNNGTGKTALLEAIHYLCYLRSFRTYVPRDLISFKQGSFFISGTLLDDDLSTHNIQIGVTAKKKVVKFNQRMIVSFKELVGRFRVITLSEADLQIIQGGPEQRRSFIDQYIFLHDPSFAPLMRDYRTTVEQRNALLQQKQLDTASYTIWTQQLWHQTKAIQKIRIKHLQELEKLIKEEQASHFVQPPQIVLRYISKRNLQRDFDAFLAVNPTLQHDESRLQRSLFGAHIDDFVIRWHDKHSRLYASRGEQKLAVLLLKIAQMKGLREKIGESILLLDDFMTDFDERRIKQLLPFLFSLKCPIFFTCAQNESILHNELYRCDAQEIVLEETK